MRDFDKWFGEFRESIATYSYYVDFKKVVMNARVHKAELHLLNSLIGSRDVEKEFRALVEQYPRTLAAVPILLAKRESDIFAADDEGGGWHHFGENTQSLDVSCTFMRKTGLFDLIANHLVNNLYDYVLGVEVGLDSNGRKNRGGHLMEDLVEKCLQRSNLTYCKEMQTGKISKRFGVDLSPLTNMGKTVKRFDFVVKTEACVYAIEANFYGGGGSKLNETARSYKMLALEARRIPNFKFVWFTDGGGWKGARQNLRETFDVLPDVYNIRDLETGIATRLFI